MIKVKKATKESRKRDVKRNRVVLHLGHDWKLHITREEAKDLGKQIIKLLNER